MITNKTIANWAIRLAFTWVGIFLGVLVIFEGHPFSGALFLIVGLLSAIATHMVIKKNLQDERDMKDMEWMWSHTGSYGGDR